MDDTILSGRRGIRQDVFIPGGNPDSGPLMPGRVCFFRMIHKVDAKNAYDLKIAKGAIEKSQGEKAG
jgi:hypothetical protein